MKSWKFTSRSPFEASSGVYRPDRAARAGGPVRLVSERQVQRGMDRQHRFAEGRLDPRQRVLGRAFEAEDQYRRGVRRSHQPEAVAEVGSNAVDGVDRCPFEFGLLLEVLDEG